MQLLWLILFNYLALNKDLIPISYMAYRAPSSQLLVFFSVAQHLNFFLDFSIVPQHIKLFPISATSCSCFILLKPSYLACLRAKFNLLFRAHFQWHLLSKACLLLLLLGTVPFFLCVYFGWYLPPPLDYKPWEGKTTLVCSPLCIQPLSNTLIKMYFWP